MVPVDSETVHLAQALAAQAVRAGIPTTYTAMLRSAVAIGMAELQKKFAPDEKKDE